MKVSIALATIVALAQPSFAEECWVGQEIGMIAAGWSAALDEQGWTEVKIEIQNGFEKDVRSSIARAVFNYSKGNLDHLQAPIFPQKIAAGETRTIEFAADAARYRELIGATEDKFRLQICVLAVSFDDGTDEEFTQF